MGAHISRDYISIDRNTARSKVLDDHASRLVIFTDRRPCCIKIEVVVIRELFALQLLCISQAGCCIRVIDHAEECCALVRVLAVTQILCFRKIQGSHLGEYDCRVDLFREPGSDGAIVLRGGVEHIERELKTCFIGGRAIMSAHLFEHCIIERRIGNDCDRSEILRRTAQHRRTSNIDVLDALSEISTTCDRLLEFVEIHDNHVDHLDAMLFSLVHVALKIATGEQATVYAWMQRLHAPIHHLRELRDRIDRRDGNARFFEHTCRTASRDDLNTEFLHESRSEFSDAGLVGDREQCAFDDWICHE